jgi:hypothetical protein
MGRKDLPEPPANVDELYRDATYQSEDARFQ